ncbi:hypothetical protein [Coleofasciculus sp.]|uniref:hypothetical protein n=1 Tax=Coleofasciculus sp. TaxID=3100458 RepID=UPI003A123D07
MNSDVGNMENPKMNLPYEQPNLKKYGTMKEITLSGTGSSADMGGGSPGNENTDADPVRNDTLFGDVFEDNTSPNSDDNVPLDNSRLD